MCSRVWRPRMTTHPVVVHHVMLELRQSWRAVGWMLAHVHGGERLGTAEQSVVQAAKQVPLKQTL